MDKFTFKFWKAKHKDGREGVVMMGDDPDHYSAYKIINGFLGKQVVEVNGSGLGIHLFLPEDNLDDWQKIALCDDAWDKKIDKEQEACLDLKYLRGDTIKS